jgi:hypothetical protein
VTVFVPPPDFLESPRGRRFGVPPQRFRTDALPGHVVVVIVGGGLAAIGVAGALWHAGVRDVVIVDRVGRLGGQFPRWAVTPGQRVPRSPYDHHPGAEGYRDCELPACAWALHVGVDRAVAWAPSSAPIFLVAVAGDVRRVFGNPGQLAAYASARGRGRPGGSGRRRFLRHRGSIHGCR